MGTIVAFMAKGGVNSGGLELKNVGTPTSNSSGMSRSYADARYIRTVNNTAPDVNGNVTITTVLRTAGVLTDGDAVSVSLAPLGLVGLEHTLSVTPASGCSIRIEYSTDGSTFTELVVAQAFYRSVWTPDSTPITHLRFTRTAGTATTSRFSVS